MQLIRIISFIDIKIRFPLVVYNFFYRSKVTLLFVKFNIFYYKIFKKYVYLVGFSINDFLPLNGTF
ncbi:Hypothetical protein I595_3215 [Croceitalea dokdonensis DOKDO 023]|uniref:Uncharacterized protein n=1 Tax=Croceitalea dokdonensis DOKDO 023 TaxID=1300341 RepID=A0A0P7AS18_9FLAO|nr:Hypothetical protein I595_3215 [Croceitalea dokdonensis DOKDO 023]